MSEPTGPELAARLRALLPPARQASFDEMLDLYTYEFDDARGQPTNSTCGALMALTGPFHDCLADGDFATASVLLKEMETLLEEFPEAEVIDGSITNSVLACFLEAVLPVEAAAYEAIVPHLGPRIRAHAEQYDPWWLEPEPPYPPEQAERERANLARSNDPVLNEEVERLRDALATYVSRDIHRR